jgi:hypothetical protein
MNTAHICKPEFCHLPGMREFYQAVGTIPTSENADTALIRSHIAYWSGAKMAESAIITPSRGHSYRVKMDRDFKGYIVKIVDHYDHRDGVTGWSS